jgi:hypothetical protein
MKAITGLLLPAALLIAACDQKAQSFSVIQQYSELMSEWHDVVCVYGFAIDNAELAEITRDAYSQAFPERKYQVVTREMPAWKYERLKKQVAAP